MKRSDLKARITGLVLLLMSAGTTAAHRDAYEQAYSGPATSVEFVLGLLTFMLASTGLLLLLHGGKLFGRKPDDSQSSNRHGVVDDPVHASSAQAHPAGRTHSSLARTLARQAILSADARCTFGGEGTHIRQHRKDPLSGNR